MMPDSSPLPSGPDPSRQYVIGTAGHIDHGKTALVKALTGVDTDRLPEEKARGITIDLGFAHMGKNITFIDVPGHERLVKNMVAGVSTIDLVLLVVAADDGVMPQTREHLDIIRLLGISHGVVAISKIDLVEPDWLQLVEEDLRGLLRSTPLAQSPVVKTSAATGAGIKALREALGKVLATLPPRVDQEIYRQPVDRVFSVKGYGTVVTGTVLSGSLKVGDEVEIQPVRPPLRVRVRGLQSHDAEVERVKTGDRAAVNLAGVDIQTVPRGRMLVQPGLFEPAEILNARLHVLASCPIPVKNNQRLRLHIHTAETFARIIIPTAPQLLPGQNAYVQFRLEQPVHAAFQDRFIIRQFSPQRTIGGGVVLQINPRRYRKRRHPLFTATLERLESADPLQRILAAFDPVSAHPLTRWQLKIATNLPLAQLQETIRQLQNDRCLLPDKIGKLTLYFSTEQLAEVLARIEPNLATFHQRFPGRPGLKTGEITSRMERFYPPEAVRKTLEWGVSTNRLARDGEYFRLADFSPQLSAKDSEKYHALEKRYREARFAPPTIKEILSEFELSANDFKELSKILREEGKLVFVDANLLFHSEAMAEIEILLKNYFQKKAEITVPEFKNLIGTTRKHAIPLLEYLDDRGVTQRAGDVRKAGPRLY